MKNKICMICKTTIEKGKQEYVMVKHFGLKEETKSKGYYHLNCYLERLRGNDNTKQIQEQALKFLKGAQKMVGIEEQKEVYI